ncbi:MAG: hypothetical protein PSX36_09010 [bacterium]|nr:hypothetical protein [bacterium]
MKNKFLTICLATIFSFVGTNNALYATGINYYLQAGGTITNLNHWWTVPNGSGANPTSFALGDIWNFNNLNSAVTLSSQWGLDAAATVNLGDGTAAFTLTYGSGAILGITSSTANLVINNNATLLLNTNYNFDKTKTTLNPGSIIWYQTGTTLLAEDDYDRVYVSSVLSASGSTMTINNFWIPDTYTVNLISNSRLNLIGTWYMSSGALAGDGTGHIFITGGNNVYIMAAAGASFATLNASGGGNIYFISDMTVTGDYDCSSIMRFQGYTLTLNGNITLHEFFGYPGSYLNIGGTGTITNNLTFLNSSVFLYLRSMAGLILNRPGAILNVASPLDIYDQLTASNGTINCVTPGDVRLHSETIAARIGPMGASGGITGSIIVETKVPGPNTGWAILGGCGVVGQTVGSWDGQLPMSCNACLNSTSSVGTGFNSVQGWNEVTGDYDQSVGAGTSISSGKGLWFYVGTGLNTTTDISLTNTGNIIQHGGTIPLSKTTGTTSYNLISNPYASPISWASFRGLNTNSSKMNDAIYGWNADLNGGTGGAVQYVGGTSNPSGITGMNNVIPAGQGFYVEALSTTTIDYDETIKSTANTAANPLLRGERKNNDPIVRLRLADNSNYGDETVIHFHPYSSNSFDGAWDAHKIFQTPGYVGYPGPYTAYTSLSTKDANDLDYAIQTIPPATQSVISIPVLAKVMSTGTYSISALEYEDVNNCIILMDKLLGKTQDLKAGPYVFTISDTTSAPRFLLYVCKEDNSAPTGIINNYSSSKNVIIAQDMESAYVQTQFDKNTKATISVFNIVGQKLINDIAVEGTETMTRLNLNVHDQVVLIKVSTDTESLTKKIVVH